MTARDRSPASVRGLLGVAVAAIVVVTVLGGALAALGTYEGLRSLRTITEDVQPTVAANAAVLQHMTDAESGVRAWAQSGDPAALEPYRQAVGRLPDDLASLRTLAADLDDDELVRRVAVQERATQAWFADYATARAAREGGPGTFSPEQFQRGRQRFDALRAAHAGVVASLDEVAERTREDAQRSLVTMLVATALLLVAGLLAARSVARRTTTLIRDPLLEVEDVVRRQASGETTARAPVEGVSEIRRVAAALNQLADENDRARHLEEQVQEELRALDRARGDFVSNVSHELRTPLTTLAGYLELLEDEFGGRLGPRHARMVEAADRNVKRLASLVEDLLTLARAESRSTDVEDVDLAAMLTETATDLAMSAGGRGITIELDVQPALHVLADRSQLSRALLNVAGNAVKFSASGDRVRLEGQRVGPDVRVRVVDEGMGIPAADLPHVGGRFFRAGNAVRQQVSGTGLGLRIVQTIVANHRGTLSLESEEGRGTTVTLLLPARGGESDPASQGASGDVSSVG